MSGVAVRKSPIQGKGVYASKNFKKDEAVLEIDDSHIVRDTKELTREELENNCDHFDNKIVLMQSPEVFINHSCDPSTYVKTISGARKVLALHDIKIGDEITYDYSINGDNEGTFECHCGSQNCRGIYYGNFFKLPVNLQKRYLPYLDDWFIKEHKEEVNKLRLE